MRFNDTPYSLEPNMQGKSRWLSRPAGDPVGGARRRHRQRLEGTGKGRADHRARSPPVGTRRLAARRAAHRVAPAGRPPRGPPAVRLPDGARRTDRVHRNRQPRASEVLMQDYYRTPSRSPSSTRSCCRTWAPPFSAAGRSAHSRSTNASRTCHELLDVVDEEVFGATPAAILECFLLLSSAPNQGHDRAHAARLWRARNLIDDRLPPPIRPIVPFPRNPVQQPRGWCTNCGA
jgi:hypothetical protein